MVSKPWVTCAFWVVMGGLYHINDTFKGSQAGNPQVSYSHGIMLILFKSGVTVTGNQFRMVLPRRRELD